MPVDVAKLSPRERTDLLQFWRRQVGDAAFEEAVARFGEDAVLQVAADLARSRAETAARETANWTVQHVLWFGSFWLILTAVIGVGMRVTPAGGQTLGGWPMTILFFLSPLLWLLMLAAKAVLDAISVNLWQGCGILVAFLLLSVAAAGASLVWPGRTASAFAILMLGAVIAWPVQWLAGRMARRS